MKHLLAVVTLTFALVACTQTQLHDTMTAAESIAWSAANSYETANAATGGALTTSLLNAALVQTHNTPDIAIVDALGKQADSALAAVAAAKAKAIQDKLAQQVVAAGQTAAAGGASASGIQAAQTAALSDPLVIAKAAAAAPDLNAEPPAALPVTQ